VIIRWYTLDAQRSLKIQSEPKHTTGKCPLIYEGDRISLSSVITGNTVRRRRRLVWFASFPLVPSYYICTADVATERERHLDERMSVYVTVYSVRRRLYLRISQRSHREIAYKKSLHRWDEPVLQFSSLEFLKSRIYRHRDDLCAFKKAKTLLINTRTKCVW